MKKWLLILTTFILCIALVSAKGMGDEYELELEDVTTKNFVAKMGYLPLASLKMMCTYDWCDYVDGSNIDRGLEIFLKNYATTLEDDEVKASIKVKGVRITKIVMYR